jgi:TolA-binding protein
VEGFFYPAEAIALRAELKREIQIKLSYDRWPSWFIVPQELEYHAKRDWLFGQYDLFISKRLNSPRMPIALYCKALLSEYSADINVLGQKEVLHFYSDYPYERSREIWYRLYSEFGKSPESLEARWRIAKHWAGQSKFEQADKLLAQAETMLAAERSKLLEKEQTSDESLFGLFSLPSESVMTVPKLNELQRRLSQLRMLIGSDNRTKESEAIERLADFVKLNPHDSDYSQRLDGLLEQIEEKDRLYDNILLAQAKLEPDEKLRGEKLSELHKEFGKTDGGMLALYELGLLKIGLYQNQSNSEQKKNCLADARATLESFLNLYPESFCAEQVKKNLDGLPSNVN